MGNRKFQTCFISAPIGVDTQPLRDALSERGVKAWDASDMLSGSSITHSIKDLISDADFVCAVIPNGPVASNVYFELGLATGTNRPRLVFVEPKADLPVALREQPYARTSLSNAEALRFHLDAFLKNAGKSNGDSATGRRQRRSNDRLAVVGLALERIGLWEDLRSTPEEHELVSLLAEVFEAAGYIASTAPPIDSGKLRPDLAVWVDELQSALGNPLLIEVIAQQKPVPSKFRELQHILRDFQSPLGLLVVWNLDASQAPDILREQIVVTMTARELVESIGRGDFARTVLARRNSIVHSAA